MDTTLDKTATPMIDLTPAEAAILDAAAFVKFGELINVHIDREERRIRRSCTPLQQAFITKLREEGLTHLDMIVVHNGTPSQIEIDGMHGTIQYKRKIRFN